MLTNQLSTEVANAPLLHNLSNDQVERFQSTLTEITWCLKLYRKIDSTIGLIMLATFNHNRTINLTTNIRNKGQNNEGSKRPT